MNTGGEGRTFRAVEISLDPASSATRSGVEMDTDENCVGIRIGDGYASAERDENVSASRHDHSVARLFQDRF